MTIDNKKTVQECPACTPLEDIDLPTGNKTKLMDFLREAMLKEDRDGVEGLFEGEIFEALKPEFETCIKGGTNTNTNCTRPLNNFIAQEYQQLLQIMPNTPTLDNGPSPSSKEAKSELFRAINRAAVIGVDEAIPEFSSAPNNEEAIEFLMTLKEFEDSSPPDDEKRQEMLAQVRSVVMVRCDQTSALC